MARIHRKVLRMPNCDIRWGNGGIVRFYSLFGVLESRVESDPLTWVRRTSSLRCKVVIGAWS